MRKYETENLQSLSEVICNRCGKKLIVENGIIKEGVLTIRKEWDFFSEKDGEIHKFDLCESCYDEWMKQFAVPVEIEENTELLCFETYPCDNK